MIWNWSKYLDVIQFGLPYCIFILALFLILDAKLFKHPKYKNNPNNKKWNNPSCSNTECGNNPSTNKKPKYTEQNNCQGTGLFVHLKRIIAGVTEKNK
jgi:hypothetical protein